MYIKKFRTIDGILPSFYNETRLDNLSMFEEECIEEIYQQAAINSDVLEHVSWRLEKNPNMLPWLKDYESKVDYLVYEIAQDEFLLHLEDSRNEYDEYAYYDEF